MEELPTAARRSSVTCGCPEVAASLDRATDTPGLMEAV
jgi:hypothetical protein